MVLHLLFNEVCRDACLQLRLGENVFGIVYTLYKPSHILTQHAHGLHAF